MAWVQRSTAAGMGDGGWLNIMHCVEGTLLEASPDLFVFADRFWGWFWPTEEAIKRSEAEGKDSFFIFLIKNRVI